MRVTYDPAADAAFVYLTEIGPGEAASSSPVDRDMEAGAVIAVFNRRDQLVGIEILGASRFLPPSVLDRAERFANRNAKPS